MSIKTAIDFRRFDQDMRLLEYRRQYSRSFVQNLWEIIYCAAAQLDRSVPRAGVTDASGTPQSIDQFFASTGYGANMKGFLTLASPGGEGSLFIPLGDSISNVAGTNSASISSKTAIKGENVGIVVGATDTAVTPSDYKLAQKIDHGMRAANAVASLKKSYASDNGNVGVTATSWSAAAFTVEQGITLTKAVLKLYRTGVLTNATLTVVGAVPAGSGEPGPVPSSTILASSVVDVSALTTISPGVGVDFTLGSALKLLPGHVYYLVLSVAGAGSLNWRRGTVTKSTDFNSASSVDSGATWSYTGSPFVVEIWGTNIADLQYGGCEIRNIAVANPNASFIVSRLFYNNSGGNVDVKECGLYAPANRNAMAATSTFWSGMPLPFCIARDVIAPTITLADGQILQVTYTPQITV